MLSISSCNRYYWWSRNSESYFLSQGKIASYDFRDKKGANTTQDNSYNQNNAKLHNVKQVEIKDEFLMQYGYRFSSPNEYIKISFPPYENSKASTPAPLYSKAKTIEDNPKFTIATWIMVDKFDNRDNQTYTILAKDSGHWSLYYKGQLPLNIENTPRYPKFVFKWRNCDQCNFEYLSSKTIIEKNKWYYKAVTFDGKKMRLYINGQLENTMKATSIIWPSGEGGRLPIYVGRDTFYPEDFLPQNMLGVINHLNMFSRALPKKEIKSMNIYK